MNDDPRTKSGFGAMPEQWSPEARGRALFFIYLLANTPPTAWRSKEEIYEGLGEFRTEATSP